MLKCKLLHLHNSKICCENANLTPCQIQLYAFMPRSLHELALLRTHTRLSLFYCFVPDAGLDILAGEQGSPVFSSVGANV